MMRVQYMKFVKNNMSMILKLLSYQIGATVLGFMVTSVAALAGESSVRTFMLLASLFSIAFYLFLLFYACRDEGMQDGVAPARGGRGFDRQRGLKAALCAQVINAFLILMMLIGALCGIAGALQGGYRVFSIGYLPSIFFMAMYSGTLRYVLPPVGEAWTGTDMLGFAIGYLILSLLPVLLSHLGYLAGVYTSRRKNTGSKK